MLPKATLASVLRVRRGRRWLALGVVVALSFSSVAGADWPAFRHDGARTARGGSIPQGPLAPTWRHPVGGKALSSQFMAYDVDRDGVAEVLLSVGGKVAARRAFDAFVWETPLIGATALHGSFDLNGDGVAEIVASGAGQVFVLEPTDGSILFASDRSIVGVVGAVRIADLDGDGLVDIYLAAAGCGAAGSRQGAVAHSFRDGWDTAPLWVVDGSTRDYYCGSSDAVADLDGDGNPEVVAFGDTQAYWYEGRTGVLVRGSETLDRLPYGSVLTVVADLDGDGRDEIVGFTTRSSGTQRVLVIEWEGQRFGVRWERAVDDSAADIHAPHPGGVADLDGDGNAEILTSFYSAGTQRWSLLALDPLDGALQAETDAWELRGVVDPGHDGHALALCVDESETIHAFGFENGALVEQWALSDAIPIDTADRERLRRQSAGSGTLVIDLDDDGADEIVVRGRLDQDDLALRAIAVVDDPAVRAEVAFGQGAGFSGAGVYMGVTLAEPQVLLTRTDGILVALDDDFAATNEVLDPRFATPGMRTGGGYYSGGAGYSRFPLAADLNDDEVDEVLLVRSEQRLEVVSAAAATLIDGPTTLWSVPRADRATILEAGSDHFVASLERNRYLVRRDAGTGAEVWRADVAPREGAVVFDDFLGVRDAAGELASLLLLRLQPGGLQQYLLMSPADGSDLVGPIEVDVGGSSVGHAAVGNVRGDAGDEVLTGPGHVLSVLDPENWTDSAVADAAYASRPLLADLDGGGVLEVLVGAGVTAPLAFDGELGLLWQAVDDGTQYTDAMGVVEECADGLRFVTPSVQSPELELFDAGSGQRLGRAAFASGDRYPDADSTGDALVGFLGNVTLATAVNGASVALVGSSDGYLYAVDACSLALEWSVSLGAPVGEPILADTDGNGTDEIVVSVADGFVYGLAEAPPISAPEFVWDYDGVTMPTGSENELDEIETHDSLFATWAPVPGAAEYEVTIATSAGDVLTEPEWIATGAQTSAAVSGLPLELGGRYVFAVRAVGDEGTSNPAVSDGVRVVDRSPPGVSVQVDPSAFLPDAATPEPDHTEIRVTMSDRVGLATLVLEIADATGQRVWADGPHAVEGVEADYVSRWNGKGSTGAALAPADYTLTARVADLAGNEATAQAPVTLLEPVSRSPHFRVRGGGCTCNTAHRGATFDGADLLLYALLLVCCRRRS